MSDRERSWLAPPEGVRRHAPATLRNRAAIATMLGELLPASGAVLEVASGSGEHCAYFAEHFPRLEWHPSDPDPDALASIASWCAGLANVRPPVALDAAAARWPVAHADAILCINMVHISPWAATLGLMAGAGRLLPPGGPLILYGPFREAGVLTAPSNEDFDQSLRARDPAWGLRLLDEVIAAAGAQGLVFDRRVAMPANNLIVAFRRS
ncbi:class I SAM-dependent methyltransferase [Sphingomonas sp. R1]|uniref:class I SAM-dependent methyltransferase n=1 Tax=Sphingomonas sp. R1 TaxID=399176 RepID=UPI0022253865|nr:class I SAM-dependent methyltransferase [Sphingomonas sp. R1]UYY79042.1 class I SAM-dependent methyltransferase [Sphingomonas sp. R1]